MTAAVLSVAVLSAGQGASAADRVVSYQIVNAQEIPASLTGQSGNAETGRQIYFDRQLTGCSGCHGSPGGPGAEAASGQDNAPQLSNLLARMTEGTIRLWLVAPSVLSPQTEMPSYYTIGQRRDPTDPRFGEPLLSAAEIEDLIAYLTRQ
ncbi:MAG: cytochrome c [Pseudomonadota bacterium]